MTAATSPTEIAEQMYVCVKHMRRLIDSELSQHGLSVSRTKVLGALEKLGPQQQSSLATMFDLAPRTVTELVDVLERDGLVERHRDPHDRRARQVHLTVAGHDAYVRAAASRASVIERLFGSLGENRLLDLSATLDQLDREVARATSLAPSAVTNVAIPSSVAGITSSADSSITCD